MSYGLSFFPFQSKGQALPCSFLASSKSFRTGQFFFKAVDTALVDFLQEGFGAHVHHVVVHDELHLLGVHVQETIYTGAAPSWLSAASSPLVVTFPSDSTNFTQPLLGIHPFPTVELHKPLHSGR